MPMGASIKQVALFCLFVVILVPAAVVLILSGPLPSPRRGSVQVKVYVEGQGLRTMDLEEYLKGVVAAEMPANFELEALKAQAVAARTYTIKHMRAFGGTGSQQHPGADVCTDPNHGQAWISRAEMEKRWGRIGYLRWWSKISKVVDATGGEIITYRRLPIDAVYHSSCGGRTEASESVWSNVIPYLRSVQCPYESPSPRNMETLTFTTTDLFARLKLNRSISASASSPRTDLWRGRVVASRDKLRPSLRLLRTSSGGRVAAVEVEGKVFSGSDFRKLLGLRSTRFTFRMDGDKVVFVTRGNGHGVGLCQYGADGMAKRNADYREILRHYYTGVEVVPLETVYGVAANP